VASGAAERAPLLPLDLWTRDSALLRRAPLELAAWLVDPGLLTDRIRSQSGAPHDLKIVDERLGFLSAEQRALLEAPAESCFVREVELLAGPQAWVFAQTLVPDRTLELHPWLAELGRTPLGAMLAGLAGLERGPFEFATLPSRHPLAARALRARTGASDVLWARRSWFALGGRRLLVQEVVLPELGRC